MTITNTSNQYFYQNQQDQYTFYRIPKALIKGVRYQHVTMEAKLLYGILLDRMSLSGKNDWCDAGGKVFIIYTVEELMEDFGCSNKTAIKLLRELEQSDLIVRQRQGLGKPSLIYVKHIQQSEPVISKRRLRKQQQQQSGTMYRASSCTNNPTERIVDGEKESNNGQMQRNSDYQIEKRINNQTDNWADNNHAANQNDGIAFATEYEQNNLQVQPCPVNRKNSDCGHGTFTTLDTENVRGNKTERSYTERNKKEEGEAAPRSWKNIVQEQLEYDWLLESYPHNQSAIQTMVTIIADAMNSDDNAVVKVGGRERRMDDVKEQLLQLDSGHIEYVLEYLQCNTSKVQNVYGYLLTILYNAPLTMDLYYEKLVRHDQAKKRR